MRQPAVEDRGGCWRPGERSQVHPLSPVVSTLPVIPALIFAYIAFGAGLRAQLGGAAIPVALVGGVLILILIAGFRYLAWRRLTFWFDDSGDLRVDSGVINRNERKLQLSRLQSVDVVEPLVARIFSLASLRIEVAGGGENRAVLSYLSKLEAFELRHEIIARSAGVRHDAGEASETAIARVPVRDLLISLLLRGTTVVLLLASVFFVAVTIITQGAAGLLLATLTGGVPLLAVFREFSKNYNFRIAKAADGIRLRHGLLATQSQTVPPGRVAAVDFVEPLLWRRRGWVRVNLTVAGASGASGQGDVPQTVLLPVAPWQVARLMFAQVMPGVDLDAIRLQATVRKARWRAPIQWSRLAFGHDDQVFLARRGMITRHLTVVSHARCQSVRVLQGPWQRALGLASTWIDVPPGPVKIAVLYQPMLEARELAHAQTDRAQAARGADRTIRWAQRKPEQIAGE